MSRIGRYTVQVGSDSVFVYRIPPPRRHSSLRTAIFVPPLIGGGGLQQYRYFRDLNRAGHEIVSFDYRGHERSTGRFCVRNTLADTFAVLAALRKERPEERFVAIGDCYGAIPLLLAAKKFTEAFTALVLINPVPTLQYVAGPRDLFKNYFFEGGRPRLRNPFDRRGILYATTHALFPRVDQSRDHFGVLDYDKAKRLSVWREFAFYSPLSGLRFDEVPVLLVYGRADRTLRLDCEASEQRYRKRWLGMLPKAELKALSNVDHFWTDSLPLANELAYEFFELHRDKPVLDEERSIVPAPPPVPETAGDPTRAVDPERAVAS